VSPRPLVSIVLPNRNHAGYLPTSVEAILHQTWSDIELIVVDDASSDASRDIMNAYRDRDPRVRIITLPTHAGIMRAVTHGLSHAGGEYISIAAADDFIEPTFVQKSVEQLTRIPGAGLCFSDPSEFRDDPRRRDAFPLFLSSAPIHIDGGTLAALLKRNFFSLSANTIVYRRSAFEAAGGYIERLQWLSDVFVAMVVALRHGACYVPEVLTGLRLRPDSYSATNLRNSAAQQALVYEFLALLSQPVYADVRERFREAAFLPEYHFRTLIWLLRSPIGREFLTPRMAGRILLRAPWSAVRGMAPLSARRRLRALSSRIRPPSWTA